MMKSQRRRISGGRDRGEGVRQRQQRQRRKNNHDRMMNSITTTATGSNNRGIKLSRSYYRRGKLGLAVHIVAALTTAVSTCTRIGVVEAFSTTMTGTSGNQILPLTVAVTNGRRQRQQQQQQQQQHHLSRRSTRLDLFFNQRDENGNIVKNNKKRDRRQPFATPETLEELRSPGVSFPMEVRLFNDDDVDEKEEEEEHDDDNDKSLFLRFMTSDDLKSLVPMCVEEFGNHDTQQQQLQLQQTSKILGLIPWYNNPQKSIPDLWDGFCFEQLISWTLRLKLMQGNNHHNDNDNDNDNNINFPLENSTKNMIINDPVMLVLCERSQRRQNRRHHQHRPATSDNDDDSSSTATTTTITTTEEAVAVENNEYEHSERIVGMVELSLQPPNADRNPPALPLPKWIKSELASQTQIGSLQGWVTNLLIDTSCRGLGYSKILMAATEGIAKHSWDCKYIFLHADADVTSGKIPQSLYKNLGYDLVKGSTLSSDGNGNGNKLQPKLSLEDEFAWAAAAGQNLERFAAIRMVDDVALLCFSKQL
jgi:hypothetical protein